MEKRLLLFTIAILILAFLTTKLEPIPELTITGKVTSDFPKLEELTEAMISRGYFYTEEKEIVRFHLACEDNACISIKGEGKNTCIGQEDCEGGKVVNYRKKPTHLGCRKGRCLVIWEEGEDTCTTREDCPQEPVTYIKGNQE